MRSTSLFCFLLILSSTMWFAAEAFVYTCNEIKFNLVPNNLTIATPFACVVHQSNVKINFDDEQFNGENVKDLFLVDDGDGERYNFIDIANSTDSCLSGTGPWRVESEAPIEELDCKDEVTLLFSSVLPNIFIPKVLGEMLYEDMFSEEGVTVVAPAGGINFNMFYLAENETGSLDFYSGVGSGPQEELAFLRTQEYSTDEVNIYHLGPVATVKVREPFKFSMDVAAVLGSYIFSYSPVGFDVISSGASSTLQRTQNERIQINYGLGSIVTLTGSVIFDPEVHSSISLSCTDYDDVVWGKIAINESGEVNWTSQCRFLDFNYTGTLPKEETSRRSNEKIDLSLSAIALPTSPSPTTTQPTSTTTPQSTRRTTSKKPTTMRTSTVRSTSAAVTTTTTTAIRPTTSMHPSTPVVLAAFLLVLFSLYLH